MAGIAAIALGMNEEDLGRALNAMIEQIVVARTEVVALQGICAALLGELCLLHEDPRQKLGQLVSGLQGVAAGVAAAGQVDSIALTRVIEQVSTMAEQGLVTKESGADGS